MKKVFTYLAMAAMGVCALPASAETVTAYFETYSEGAYHDYFKPFELEINKTADGAYTMPNFMNSGAPVSFSFNVPEVGKNAKITVTSPYEEVATAWEWGEGYEDYYALLDANGDALELVEETPDGVSKYIYDPIIVTAQDGYLYAYVKKLNTEDGENEYQYYADFAFWAYPEDNDDGDMFYMSFYFDKVEEAPAEAPTEEITVYIDDYDGYSIADPYVTTLTANADGSYTLADFMNSGEPFSFTFKELAPGEETYVIEITSPVDDSYTYPYLMSADGKSFLDCVVYGYEGVEGPTAFVDPYVATRYCDVYRYDMSDPDNVYEYYVSICTSAYLEDDTSLDWFYVDFFFGGKNAGSAVKAVSVDENAPVEFYNLNGMRVDNPSNGIFIRRQGNSVKKVVIR